MPKYWPIAYTGPAPKVVGYTQHSMVKGRDVHARLRMPGISTYVWGVGPMTTEPYSSKFERDDNVTLPTRVARTLDVTFDSDTETAVTEGGATNGPYAPNTAASPDGRALAPTDSRLADRWSADMAPVTARGAPIDTPVLVTCNDVDPPAPSAPLKFRSCWVVLLDLAPTYTNLKSLTLTLPVDSNVDFQPEITLAVCGSAIVALATRAAEATSVMANCHDEAPSYERSNAVHAFEAGTASLAYRVCTTLDASRMANVTASAAMLRRVPWNATSATPVDLVLLRTANSSQAPPSSVAPDH